MRDRMFLCPTCGNKRCPHATHHEELCSHSNKPGQSGSSYGNITITVSGDEPPFNVIITEKM